MFYLFLSDFTRGSIVKGSVGPVLDSSAASSISWGVPCVMRHAMTGPALPAFGGALASTEVTINTNLVHKAPHACMMGAGHLARPQANCLPHDGHPATTEPIHLLYGTFMQVMGSIIDTLWSHLTLQ
jgi:hypothetical protein